MTTTVLENREKKLNQEEFLNSFTKTLKEGFAVKKSEIEKLTDIMAKNPVDKFIVSERPKDFIAQGDLLIWFEDTPQFKENYPKIKNLQPTTKMALQEDDSITGDHNY